MAVNNIPERFLKNTVVYFLRNTNGKRTESLMCVYYLWTYVCYRTNTAAVLCIAETISEPVDINEANHLMPKLVEFGRMSGHPLMMLRGLLNHVCDINLIFVRCRHYAKEQYLF